MALWGTWSDCCCDEGFSYAQSAAGWAKCEPCLRQSTAAPVEDNRLPAWWRAVGIPSPVWLREYAGWMLRFTFVPFALRMGILFVVREISKRLFGKDLTDVLGLITGVETEEGELPTRLLPGAWAFIKYKDGSPERSRLNSLTRDIIDVYRLAKRHGATTPLLNPDGAPSDIILLPASVKHMTFKEHYLALGFPLWYAVLNACLHLLGWHLLQVLLYSFAFLCCCDLLDGLQLLCGGAFCCRQVVYVGGLIVASWRRPSYLLFHPVAVQKAVTNWYLEVCSYALQPEMWILKVAFVDSTQKPVVYFVLLGMTFLADLIAAFGLMAGIHSGTLPLPLAGCYVAGTLSVALSLVAFVTTDFFTESVEGSNTERIEQLRLAGCPAEDLKAAGFVAKDLRAAGYSARDLNAAGQSAKELIVAGYTFTEVYINSGFSWDEICDAAKALRSEGHPASNLRVAGWGIFALADGGYSCEDARTAGYSEEEISFAECYAPPSW